MSPLEWARPALAQLPRALLALSLLGHLQTGLLEAGQAQRQFLTANQIDAVMAEGRQLRAKARFSEALHLFLSAARDAQALGDSDRQAKALLLATGCQIYLFRYRDALTSSEAVRRIGSAEGDNTLLGAAAGNLSTIYYQLGDFPQATEQADEAVKYLRKSWRKDYLIRALLNQANIQADSGDTSAAKQTYESGIGVAQEARLPREEAKLRDQLGISLLHADRLAEATAEFSKASQIWSHEHDQDGLAITDEHLAELKLKEGSCEAALRLIDRAFSSRSDSFRTSPQFYPIHIRAKILACEGSSRTALAEFRRAVNAADEWRRGALPGDITNTRTVTYLHDVYQDYTELAAQLALRDKDPLLAREALEVLAENRAASLREQMRRTLGSSFQLPPDYFKLMSQIQEGQARITLGKASKAEELTLQNLRLKLSELENRIASPNLDHPNPTEKFQHKNSLRDIQLRLGKNQALLSFCLGKNQSFLWAITENRVNLYELHDEKTIRTQAFEFSKAVRTGQNVNRAARSLSNELFGQLQTTVSSKPEWLLVLDGALLDGIPFSAISDPSPSRQNLPLIASRNIRLLPSELLLLDDKAPAPKPRFVGIGDPIYNLADSRRRQSPTLLHARSTKTAAVMLGRLVGSDREVRAAAASSGMPESQLLLGSQATGAAVQTALASSPEIIHFAVHVVSPPDQPQQAALALSLTAENIPELLTPESISILRVPGSLVVLSGCASEQGLTLPSAGLVGLSRAWLTAGAAAVVVSAWPTPDDSGQFFSVFYRHLQALRSGSIGERAAAALQQAQLEIQRGNGFRTSPSFWAAYSIISKE